MFVKRFWVLQNEETGGEGSTSAPQTDEFQVQTQEGTPAPDAETSQVETESSDEDKPAVKTFTQEELDAAREIMSEEEYMQEYECDWGAALVGAYYGKQMSEAETGGRIRQVPYDPAVPVETWWDLGIGDSTAIWFTQKVAGEFRIIDSLEMSGVGLDWYVRELKKKPYIYGDINLPHDAAARDLTTGKTRVEILRELWKGARINVLPRLAVEDGINAVRLILPKCWFDLERCERGIAALRSYQKKWDPKNKIYQDKPLHDWSSHFADAFRMFAIGNKYDRQDINSRNLPRECDNSYGIFH